MVLTKEEKNKLACVARFTKTHNRIQSFKWSLIHQFDKAQIKCLSHDDMLAWRNKWLLDLPAYKTLPRWGMEQLAGMWDVLHDLLWRKLEVCYKHPDTGVLTEVRVLLDLGFGTRLTECFMCWKTDRGYIPYTGGAR